jgi:hypothetical protein
MIIPRLGIAPFLKDVIPVNQTTIFTFKTLFSAPFFRNDSNFHGSNFQTSPLASPLSTT